MKHLVVFLGLWVSLLGAAYAQPDDSASVQDIYVAYPQSTDPQDPAFYYQQVLFLALDKTRETDGDFELHYSTDFYSLGRATNMLMTGTKADVMWGSVTHEREELMQVIPFDLLRGLNNYRVLIISPEQQQKFTQIKTLAEFKILTSGGGANWTSTNILRMNDIKVSTAPYYESIIKMLAAGRFDYISRGLHEVQTDLTLGKSLSCDLAIESTILLQYKTPINYSFYVKKQNTKLADRLSRGLKIADQDGSLFAAFNAIAVFREATELMNQERKIFVLDNTNI